MIGLAILLCLAPTAIDGDTVKCSWSGDRVRIFGIQAPETGMTGAAGSTAHLQSIIAGGLYCEIRGASYNRIVGQCWNYKGEDVGLSQIANSNATEWCSYSVTKQSPQGTYGTCR